MSLMLVDFAPVLHVMGFAAGIAIYAMLLATVWRSGTTQDTRLSFAAGVLGLLWNLGGLWMFGLSELGFPEPSQFLDAVAYGALGFLPAVVVHAILREESRPSARVLTALAYSLSALAAIGHVTNVVIQGFAPLPAAIHLLGPVYGALILPLMFLTDSQPGWRRALWTLALAVFALTGTELAYHSEGSLLLDFIGHQASIPLAFVILYQQYRFALADRFLRQAVTLIALVTLVLGSYIVLVPRLGPDASTALSDARVVGGILALWIGTALVYPVIQGSIGRLVDRWVLRRDSGERLRVDVGKLIDSAQTSSEVLNRVSRRLAKALNADSASWSPCQEVDATEPVSLLNRGAAALVSVPTAEVPRYRLSFSKLSEGRSLGREELALLEWVGLSAARRIDQLRVLHERYEHELSAKEMVRLATEAELRALRAQINPHFLFNALTTIGHLIQSAPERAIDTLMNLTALLRRVLQTNEDLTTLGEELELVMSYLDIERARFEERLAIDVDVAEGLRGAKVPPLILQPIVENAVKHGIAPRREGGTISIRAMLEGEDLRLMVVDSGSSHATPGNGEGVGLQNVADRLRGHYGELASLQMTREPERGTVVELRIPSATKLEGAVR